MNQTEFVYTIYIKASAEQLWKALTEPEHTRRYWGTAFTTDWKSGSKMTWEYAGIQISDPEQVVLEADPQRRLSYTWQTATAEFADAVGWSEEYFDKVAAERRSKVSFEMASMGSIVRLTLVHDGFDPGSLTLESIAGGWPMILSALKSLLETGEPLFSPMH